MNRMMTLYKNGKVDEFSSGLKDNKLMFDGFVLGITEAAQKEREFLNQKEKAFLGYEMTLGPQHAETLDAMEELAELYKMQSMLQEASDMLAEVERRRQRADMEDETYVHNS